MSGNGTEWRVRLADGGESGTFTGEELRQKVIDGEILPDGMVSRDGREWKRAAAVPECGFDCLVLQTSPSLDVLGPFAREYLDKPEVMATLPQDGAFFVRSGTLADTSGAVASSGSETGAALVSRILAAESALREARGKCLEAQSALKAKDLEFEAERAKWQSEVSSLKAAMIKQDSEVEALKAELGVRDARERAALQVEARLVDAEKKLAGALERAGELEKKAELAEKAASAAKAEVGEVRKRAAGVLAELSRSVDDAARKFGDGFAEAQETVADVAGVPVSGVPVAAVKAEVIPPAEAQRQNPSRVSQMAALETQLRKELQMAGKSAGAPPIANLFKKRK